MSSYKPFCLVITTPEREFLIAARSEDERLEWQQAIQSCVEGYDVMGTALSLISMFLSFIFVVIVIR